MPQEQLRVIVLPPDPLPILNARPELANMGETIPNLGLRLAGESGAFALTGSAATMQRAYFMSLATGSYGLTGNVAALDFFPPTVLGSAFSSGFSSGFGLPTTPIVYAAGAYGLTGSSATLRLTRPFAAASGAYAMGGHTAVLALTLGGTRTIAGDTGTFALTGHAAVLKLTDKLPEATGSFALTGSAATLIRKYVLSGSSGAYALSGSAAAVKATRKLAATTGAFAITGSAATLAARATTWNPSDKSANITLSNGNLTATGTTTTGTGFSLRATHFAGAGHYFECSFSGTAATAVCIANNLASLSTYMGIDGNGLLYDPGTGNIVGGNFVLDTVATYGVGDIVGVGVNTGPTVSFYKNGTLQSTISGGAVPSGNLYPAATLNGTTESIIANFGASAMSFLPGGDVVWDG